MQVNSDVFFFGFNIEFKFLNRAPKHENRCDNLLHVSHVLSESQPEAFRNHGGVLNASFGVIFGSNVNLVLLSLRTPVRCSAVYTQSDPRSAVFGLMLT